MSPVLNKINGFRFRSKVAAFDFDWTLVRPKNGRKFPKDVDDWEWLRANVPETIKEYYTKGWCIMIFTNQTKGWKLDQINKVLSTLDIPVLAVVAMDKADHKPSKVMWQAAVGDKKVKTDSFFVGDALGRPSDWSNTDLLFANAIGVRAVSPETMFPLPDFRSTTTTVVKVIPKDTQEVVVMVGYPGSGKTSVAKELVDNSSSTYVHVDGDALKTPAKLAKEARKVLANNKSPIIDATNPTRAGRQLYIDIAREHNVSIRCIWVKTSMEDSMARNANRYDQGKQAVPSIVYYVYRKKFEAPTTDDGFEQVVEV